MHGLNVRLSSGSCVVAVLNPCLMVSPSSAVKYAARIRDVQDPCGTPVLTSFSSSCLPLRQMAAFHSCRNNCTHFTVRIGMWNFRSVSIRCTCGMVLKNPVMLNISIFTAHLLFQLASMSCVTVMTASCAHLPLIPLY